MGVEGKGLFLLLLLARCLRMSKRNFCTHRASLLLPFAASALAGCALLRDDGFVSALT